MENENEQGQLVALSVMETEQEEEVGTLFTKKGSLYHPLEDDF